MQLKERGGRTLPNFNTNTVEFDIRNSHELFEEGGSDVRMYVTS